jgi:uncharacterized membrane protein YeaQ/YmgE (transglycosylase-associated protein family)
MSPASVIGAIVIGAIIGVLGRLVVPGRQKMPVWLTVLVGIVAALIGTAIARALGVADTARIDWLELLIQVLVAAVGVALVSTVGKRSASS